MKMSLLACHHLLHLRKRKKRWWWIRKLVVIFCTWGKNQETYSLLAFFNYSVCVHRICQRDEDEPGGSSSSPLTP
jgi:hypothetical protein